jgi:signal transduction histidine kinase
VTGRKAEEKSREAASAERLAMLEAASVARVVPWSMDHEGWMHWGESLGAVFQWPGGVARRQQGWPWERIHEEDHLRLRIALAQADQGFVSGFECRMAQKGRRWIWTRWTLAEEGGRYHGAVQDIHEQHEIQAQLLQTQKLESMGTLVGGITHDFNNLLMAILGFSELLLQDASLTKVQLRGVDTIYRAATRGRTLIDQFLGFSRKLPARRVQANLNHLLEEACRLLQHALSKNVDLRLELAPDLPDAHFDPGQLHQVVMNLTLNARDAIQDHGTIILRTGLANVGPEQASAHGRPEGAYLLLEVADDGVGIPAEALHRIFEPFFTTKGAKGTGLGLSMVHGIVMEHGGLLECRSKVGEGTAMRILLPLMAAPGPQLQASPGAIPRLGILVLATGAALQERLTGALGMLGQTGALASSPEDALEHLGRGGWDLLVLEPEALPAQGRAFLRALEEKTWKGRVLSVGTRLDPAFQSRTLGHLSRTFTLFDLVEILDRVFLLDPDFLLDRASLDEPHVPNPAP